MERVWQLPPTGWVKINVHGEFRNNVPARFQNRNGIGVVIRDHEGTLLKLSYGTIPINTNLQNSLWAILIGMRRAFRDNHQYYILETDNIDAYRECKYYKEEGIDANVQGFFRNIISRMEDTNFNCDLRYVHQDRNRVARRLANVGMETMHNLESHNGPVANIQELLDLDIGLGPADDQFQDHDVFHHEPDGQVDDNVHANMIP